MSPMERFIPGGLATAIGSLPHTDPEVACRLVARYLPELPPWPQLPRRSYFENMYVQFSEGFPGVKVDEADERIWVERPSDQALEGLYAAYLEARSIGDATSAIADRLRQKGLFNVYLDAQPLAVSSSYAAGLHAFLSHPPEGCLALKGQVTGPVSLGLAITDHDRRPILYDDELSRALAFHVMLKAKWQEEVLRALSKETILFLDEPYLSSLGSAFVSLSREKATDLIEEALGGIQGLKGAHCCGNTDWSLLLATSIDILSLDAYNYAQSLSLYPREVKAFLERGGVIAWGIVPSEEEALKKETVASLVERLGEAMALLERKGLKRERLLSQALVTPSCGLGTLSGEAAERALELTAGFSRQLRGKAVP